MLLQAKSSAAFSSNALVMLAAVMAAILIGLALRIAVGFCGSWAMTGKKVKPRKVGRVEAHRGRQPGEGDLVRLKRVREGAAVEGIPSGSFRV